MPFYDAIQSLLGTPNPADELEQWSKANYAANVAAAGGGQPNTDGQAKADVAAQNSLQPNQTPQALKTPGDLGSILVDLQRHEQANQLWNQSLGMGFAAVSQPRDREMVSKMFNVQPLDAQKLGQTVMEAGNYQQGQNRMNQLLGIANQSTDPNSNSQLVQLARANNMDPASLALIIKQDPAKASAFLVAGATPTDQMRNLEQINRYIDGVQQRGQKDPTILAMIRNAMLANMAGPDAEAAVNDAQAYKAKNGKDAPWVVNGQIDQGAYKRYQAVVATRDADRTEAQTKMPASEAKLSDIERQLDEIENDPALPGLMNKITPTTGSWSLVATGSAERALAQKIDQLTSENYVQGLSDPGLGNRKTQQEMTYVGKALSGVLNARNINLDDYKAGIERLKDRVYETHGNLYGETGDFSNMDPKYNGYVNDAYRKGPLSEGIIGAPQRQPLDDEAMTFWKNGVAAGKSKSELLHILRTENYDTSRLQ